MRHSMYDMEPLSPEGTPVHWTGGDPGMRGRFILNTDGTLGAEVGT